MKAFKEVYGVEALREAGFMWAEVQRKTRRLRERRATQRRPKAEEKAGGRLPNGEGEPL